MGTLPLHRWPPAWWHLELTRQPREPCDHLGRVRRGTGSHRGDESIERDGTNPAQVVHRLRQLRLREAEDTAHRHIEVLADPSRDERQGVRFLAEGVAPSPERVGTCGEHAGVRLRVHGEHAVRTDHQMVDVRLRPGNVQVVQHDERRRKSIEDLGRSSLALGALGPVVGLDARLLRSSLLLVCELAKPVGFSRR